MSSTHTVVTCYQLVPVCVCVCVQCVGVSSDGVCKRRDGRGEASGVHIPSRASDCGAFVCIFVCLGTVLCWCVCVPVCVGGSAAMKQLPVGLTTLQCWAKETEGENGRGENQLQKAHWLTLITVLSQLKQEQQPQHPDWDSFTQELYLFNV